MASTARWRSRRCASRASRTSCRPPSTSRTSKAPRSSRRRSRPAALTSTKRTGPLRWKRSERRTRRSERGTRRGERGSRHAVATRCDGRARPTRARVPNSYVVAPPFAVPWPLTEYPRRHPRTSLPRARLVHTTFAPRPLPNPTSVPGKDGRRYGRAVGGAARAGDLGCRHRHIHRRGPRLAFGSAERAERTVS